MTLQLTDSYYVWDQGRAAKQSILQSKYFLLNILKQTTSQNMYMYTHFVWKYGW